MIQFILAYFCLIICEVKSECGLLNQNDKSSELLKKLQPLFGSTFTYEFADTNLGGDKYTYTLSICEPLSVDGNSYSNAGVIQVDANQKPQIVGRVNSTVLKGGNDWMMLTYSGGNPYRHHCRAADSAVRAQRQAHVMIVCDPARLQGEFRVLYEENDQDQESDCFYMMELTTSVVCSLPPSTGLSTGSILLIVFFTLAGVYLIAGSMYKRCVHGSKGWDQIPNVAFWKSCGALQADGCNWLCRCQDVGYSQTRPYQGIADDQLGDDDLDDTHLLPA